MPVPSSISVHYLHVAIKHCQRHNINAEQLLLDSSISTSLLNSSSMARVSTDQYALLCKNLQYTMRDEAMGYYQQPQQIGTLRALLNHMFVAHTVHQALEYAAQFYAMLNFGFHYEIQFHGNNCHIVLVNENTHPLDQWVYEEQLTKLHRMLRWLSNQRLPINYVELPFSKPAHHQEYPLIFGAPIRFKANANCAKLILKSEQLEHPLVRQRIEIQGHQEDMAHSLLKLDRDRHSYSELVRQALNCSFPSPLSYEQIAQQLNLHPQTLRRRLSLEGHDFREIKNNLIRDLAIESLIKKKLSIKEIAYQLGFKEITSFSRAFKKATGQAPLTYQREWFKQLKRKT